MTPYILKPARFPDFFDDQDLFSQHHHLLGVRSFDGTQYAIIRQRSRFNCEFDNLFFISSEDLRGLINHLNHPDRKENATRHLPLFQNVEEKMRNHPKVTLCLLYYQQAAGNPRWRQASNIDYTCLFEQAGGPKQTLPPPTPPWFRLI